MPDETSTTTFDNNGVNAGTSAVGAGLNEPNPQANEPPKNDPKRPTHGPADGKVGGINAKLFEAIQKYREEVLIDLTGPRGLKRLLPWSSRSSHPELLQVYGIIHSHLCEVQRLLAERAVDAPGRFDHVAQQLSALLDRDRAHARTDIHAAWALAGSLERINLMLGDDNYVTTRLESEHEREQKKLRGSWSEYLAVETLEDLLAKFKAGGAAGPRGRAVEYLALLYARRVDYMRMLRAGEEMKADYLNRLTLLLALLLFLLLEGIYVADHRGSIPFKFNLDLTNEHIRNALVAVMTGAVGSTLSGFYKLRDATGGIVALRAFRSAMWAQPFVGATVGVLMMLLIKSGVVAIMPGAGATTTWLPLAVFCFAAGFSEPFFLGVVQRVAGAADKKTQGAAEGGAAGKAGDDKK